jgi:hypothetical protein
MGNARNTLVDKIICHLFDTKKVEYENHFLLECPTYIQIRSQFQNICHNTDLPTIKVIKTMVMLECFS